MQRFVNVHFLFNLMLRLSRARKIGTPLPQSITKSTQPMLKTINDLFGSIGPDLEGINSDRYQRQVSSGIQEYMEAVLFQHYLETERIMSHDEAGRTIAGGVQLTHADYVLGLFDMTGELMRFAITYLAMNGSLPEAEGNESARLNVLTDLQNIRCQLETVDASSSFALAREFDKKLQVTRASVEKVEYCVFSMLVRGKERPTGWRPDTIEGPREGDEVEAY